MTSIHSNSSLELRRIAVAMYDIVNNTDICNAYTDDACPKAHELLYVNSIYSYELKIAYNI